jgi:hypothetical protein
MWPATGRIFWYSVQFTSCGQQQVAVSGTVYSAVHVASNRSQFLVQCTVQVMSSATVRTVDARTVTLNSEIIKMPHRKLLKKDYFHDSIFSLTVSRLCNVPYLSHKPDRRRLFCSLTLSNSAPSQSWLLLQRPAIPQPFQKFPAFYGIWRFIAAFTRACHMSLP